MSLLAGLLIGVLISLSSHVSFGVEIHFSDEAQRPEKQLARTMSKKAEAVVEARANADGAFEVTHSWFGHLESGDRLEFQDCTPLGRGESSAEQLEYLVHGAPVVGRPVMNGSRVALPHVAGIEELPRPADDARYVLVLSKLSEKPGWTLPRKTTGDVFLVQDERVHFFDYGTLDHSNQGFWILLRSYPSYSSFVSFLEKEISKRSTTRERGE